ncbi:hypothetical protein C5Y93_16285 [Blastopirellula marina]|uniref:Uncharacterized protein n=2 Tax=Blastopirellula marina TaxID=124 RepID=A0A2S8GL92_9BACT|nr:hypothetical protein C5Y93_16285 [Blastopirellula marina]
MRLTEIANSLAPTRRPIRPMFSFATPKRCSAPTAIRYASGLAAAETETELDKQRARYLIEMLGGTPRHKR